MGAHSKISAPSPKHIMNPIFRNLFRYGNLTNKSNWEKLISDLHALYIVEFSIWNTNVSKHEILTNVKCGDVAGLYDFIFGREMEFTGAELSFIKENQLYEFYPFINKFFPDSKFVYLIRDPRDMALSWKASKSHVGGFLSAARQWKKDQQNSLKLTACISEDNLYILKYEDLISNTSYHLKKLCKYLGLDYEEGMLSFYKSDTVRTNASREDNWKNLSKPVMSNNSNKFLQHMSKEDILFVEYICQFEMPYFGYERISSLESLNIITEEMIAYYEAIDLKSSVYDVPQKTLENMRMKKRIYER